MDPLRLTKPVKFPVLIVQKLGLAPGALQCYTYVAYVEFHNAICTFILTLRALGLTFMTGRC